MTRKVSNKPTDMSYKIVKRWQNGNKSEKTAIAKEKTQFNVQMDTGIEQALLSKYESGKRMPPTETLITLADYYNVSIDYIMGRTDKPEINQ